MARHRDIRNMDFEEDYMGYDDVYGHSVDEDYSISPSNGQFIYNRESSKDAKLEHDEDIQEADEADELSDTEKAQLYSCMDEITNTLGANLIPRNELIHLILMHKFNVELVINAILEKSGNETDKEKVSTVQPPILIEPTSSTSVKVTNIVVKGFDLPERNLEFEQKNFEPVKIVDLMVKSNSLAAASTSRSQSPMSGRNTPNLSGDVVGKREPKNEDDSENQNEYEQERGNGKEHLYMVVVGHVDAGKSTLMGRLLWELGQINKKTMHKYEQDSKKVGKQSFMYAWVLDETGEERERGITMDIGRYVFEIKTKQITILDAPGHKDFIPNMISGAAQADVALLVVDATRGEFETGFDLGGQTREHALLVRSLGVNQIVVAINKLDTVNWAQERFNEINLKLKVFLKQVGFKDTEISFVPCSGLTGQNLTEPPSEQELLEWYIGPCLIDVIDKFKPPIRPVGKPFRFSVNDVFKGTGSGFCVDGRIETGSLHVGDKVLVCPNKDQAVIKSINVDSIELKPVAFAGDQATLTLSGIEFQNLSVGNILCHLTNPVPVALKFEARIVVFNLTVPITKGFCVSLHHQSLTEPAVLSKLISQLNKSTGEIVKNHPRYLTKNCSAIVELTCTKPIAVELYSDFKELGRVMLRVGGYSIAAGVITRIIPLN